MTQQFRERVASEVQSGCGEAKRSKVGSAAWLKLARPRGLSQSHWRRIYRDVSVAARRES